MNHLSKPFLHFRAFSCQKPASLFCISRPARRPTTSRARRARDPENTQRSAPSARAALARDNACTVYATAAHCCAIHCCRHTVKLPHLPHCIFVAAVAITLLRPRCCCQHALRLPRHILAQTSLAGSSNTFKPSNFGACLPRSPELKRNREAGKPHTFAPTPLFVGSNAFSCFPSQSALSR
jgi:hypothetical protein